MAKKNSIGFPNKEVGGKQAPMQDQGMKQQSAVSPTHPGPNISVPPCVKTESVKGTDIGHRK